MSIPPDDESMVTVSVAFSYVLTCVPKGCRDERDVLVRDTATAAIRSIAATKAQEAYRLRFPADNPSRYSRPTRTEDVFGRRAAKTIVLIRYADALWWPWENDRYRSRYDVGGVSDLIARLRDGSSDLLALQPDTRSWSDAVDRPPTRSVAMDRWGDATATVQAKVYANLLLCGDRVYVRGGEPVYVRNRHALKRTWEIQIVGLGADRAAEPRERGIDAPPGDFMDWSVQRAIRHGDIWRADMHDLAASAAHPMQRAIPRIRVIGTEPSVDRTIEAVIDAIYREAMRLARQAYAFERLPGVLAPGLKTTSDDDTTRRRRRALREYFAAAHPWSAVIDLHERFRSFERAVPESGGFAPEDDEAISSLGG